MALYYKNNVVKAAAVLLLCAGVALSPIYALASSPYLSSGTVTSTNLLAGNSAASISNFHYILSSLPGNSSVTIQFSQDGTNWYSSAGALGGHDTLSTVGGADVSLSTLGWSGTVFYYRITLNATSDLTASPVINGIRLDYAPASGYGNMLAVDNGSGHVKVGGGVSGGSQFAVNGGATFGPDYVSATTTNGILVEGWAGFGTTSPTSQLTLDNSGNGKFFEALNSGVASGKGGLVFSHYSDSAGGTDVTLGNNYYLNSSGSIARQDITNSGWDMEMSNRTSFNGFSLNYINSSGATSTFVTITSGGKIGVSTTSPDTLLTVGSATPVGNVAHFENSTGSCYINPTTTSLSCSSDARLKSNINSLATSSGIASLMLLNPVTYNWNSEATGTPAHSGFIAQQVLPILPDLVSQGPDGYYTLNYAGFTPYLVKAVQEVASISGVFKQNLIAWLGIASNGIVDLFAQNGHFSNELCVGSTCVTAAQFQAMVAAAGQSSNGNSQPQVQISDPTPPVISGTSTPPIIIINGNNPAIIQVGDTYTDLGAIVTDNQGTSLGYKTFVNGILESTIVIDTTQVATDTIDYVATDTWGNTSTSTRTVVIEAINNSGEANSTGE